MYLLLAPRDMDLGYYYSVMDRESFPPNLANVESDAKRDIAKLKYCQEIKKGVSSEDCYKDFYEKYTLKNGLEKAFAHLHFSLKLAPEILPGCHYIAHGIGAGAYNYYGKNLSKAYNFPVYDYFTNIGACANGYYHGIAIGFIADLKTDKQVEENLRNYCNQYSSVDPLGEENCEHGLGHAIMFYFEGNEEKGMEMCKKIFETSDKAFDCMSGVRMQYGMDLQVIGLASQKMEVSDLKGFCEKYEANTPEREACIFQISWVLRDGEKYIESANKCQELENASDRKPCTKIIIMNALRYGRSLDARKICDVPKSLAERIECVAFFTQQLALGVDIKRGDTFRKVQDEGCHTLSYFNSLKCRSLLLQKAYLYRSNIDYGGLLNLQDIKALLVWGKGYKYPCRDCGTKMY